MKIYKSLKAEELVDLYRSYKNGIGPTELGRKYGVYNTSILSAVESIDKYLLSGKTPLKNSYIKAVKIIKESQENGVITTYVKETDPYSILEAGLNAFIESAISPFVEAYIQKKIKDKNDYIDKIETENRELKGLLEKAKTQNWVTNLKKSFRMIKN